MNSKHRSMIMGIALLGMAGMLASCGGSGGGDDDNPEVAPTTSVLVSTRSPDHNDINVSSNTDITITADPSILNDTLFFTLWDLGQNEGCFYTWAGINCAYGTGRFRTPTIQGNTATLNLLFPLTPETNYLVVLSNDFTASEDDDFLLYWTFRTKPGGVFLDSPVVNIDYRTESSEGVTNAQGLFEYLPGESVTFFIGDLVFPTVPAKATVTPLDLAGKTDIDDPIVVNMIRLLQTLDLYKDPLTDITIPEPIKAAATPVDFNLSESDFENSAAVMALVAEVSKYNFVGSLIATTAAKSNFQRQLDALEKLNFNASTLPGIYDVVVDAVAGTQQLTINVGGSADFVWSDGGEESGTWAVNSSGQLLLSNSTFSDILTLTSGSQLSGDLEVVIDDEDGLVNSPGTIKLTAGLTTTFDGSYNFTAISTTFLNNFNIPCENASGVMSIENSMLTGSVTGASSGGTASISGTVQPDGSLSSVDLASSVSSFNVTGIISGASGIGTWNETFGCAGTWEMTKN